VETQTGRLAIWWV